MAAVEAGGDEVIFVRRSEWDALSAEVEELRDTVALLVALAHQHEGSIVQLKDALNGRSLLD